MKTRDLQDEPYRFDFYTVLRVLERSHPGKPRIGDSATLRDDFAWIGQDPYLDFPASTLARVEKKGETGLAIYQKFLGLLGMQGALPLATTHESYLWQQGRDDSFARFLDILNHRFLQLFFRAWADARPIAQHDRPEADRFADYVGSTIGLGTWPYQGLDTVPDASKLAFAGLLGPQAKSASRLRGFLEGLFGCKVEIDEFVGSHLDLEPGEQTRLGRHLSGLGVDTLLGASVYSVQDKFRVRIFTAGIAPYEEFLPAGRFADPIADAVFFYIGDMVDWDVELAIPAEEVRGVRLGSFGRLGWTTWMAPERTARPGTYRRDARYHPADRLKQKRSQASQDA